MATVKFTSLHREYELEIIKGKSITIKCEGKENTFNIGDQAEYDSYNFSYHGKILSITEKTVTIEHEYGKKKSRLNLEQFAWRNRNFNLEEVAKRNRDVSYNI